MKHTVKGITQTKAIEYNLKLIDVYLLSWALEVMENEATFKTTENDKTYYWLKVDNLLKDYPILGTTKKTILNKYRYYVKNGFFEKISKITHTGTFGYYLPTSKFLSLFKDSRQSELFGNPTPQKWGEVSQKNGGVVLKKWPLPSLHNPLHNNPPNTDEFHPPKMGGGKGEGEECFQLVRKELLLADANEIWVSIQGLTPSIVKHRIREVKNDPTCGIGVLLKRLRAPRVEQVPHIYSNTSKTEKYINEGRSLKESDPIEKDFNIMDELNKITGKAV